MKYFTDRTNSELIDLLLDGGVGVLRTDTIYGIVAAADHPDAVEQVYEIRGRDRMKACIVLIGGIDDLFDEASPQLKTFMADRWPGPVSVVVPSPSAPDYLKAPDGTIAYRVPADDELRILLKATGPLIAPSANPQGEPTAKNIAEAEEYFGETIDFYVDGGEVEHVEPSQLWRYNGKSMERLR